MEIEVGCYAVIEPSRGFLHSIQSGGVVGSIFGAVLVQTTANGPVMLKANSYLYPLVNNLIIVVAAWVAGRRRLMTERIEQRKIRVEA